MTQVMKNFTYLFIALRNTNLKSLTILAVFFFLFSFQNVSAQVDIFIEKTVSDQTVDVGQEITYTIKVTNEGPSAATGIVIQEVLPAGVTFVAGSSAPGQGTYDELTNVWTLGALAKGKNKKLEFNVTIDPGTAGEVITNTATVSNVLQTDSNITPDTFQSVTVSSPDISVVKTVDNSTPDVSELVIYTITVKNEGTGAAAATNLIINDDLPIGMTYNAANSVIPAGTTYNDTTGEWTIPTLLDNVTLVLEIAATVDLLQYNNTIVNTASVQSLNEPVQGNVTDNDSASLTVTNDIPDILITKVVDDATPDEGQLIEYTIKAKNVGTGTAPATGLFINDDLPTGVTYNLAGSTIPAGTTYNPVTGLWDIGILLDNVELTLILAATVDTSTSGFTITNIASLDAMDQNDSNLNNNSAFIDVIVNFPDIQILKTVSAGPWNELQNLTYTIKVKNLGASAATGIVVQDLLPGVMTYDSHTVDQGTYSNITGLWAIGDLANGVEKTLTLIASPNIGTSGTDVNNTAFLSALDQNDTNLSNNSSSASILVATSDLLLEKSANDPSPDEGQTVEFTLKITNNGPGDATGIDIEDVLPAGLTFVAFTSTPSGTFSETAETVSWNLDLTSGSNQSLKFTATVGTGYAAQTITNFAEVITFDQVDTNRDDNEASVDLFVNGADLEVTKTVDNLAPNPGDTIIYTIVIRNNGPLKAQNVIILDNLPTGVTYVSDDSGGDYVNGTGLWTIGDVNAYVDDTNLVILNITATVDAGTIGSSITNTASVSSVTQGDSLTANNSDSATIAIGEADLGLTKTASAPGDGIAYNPGETVTYTITIENYGPHDAPLVEVLDVLPEELTYVSSSTISGSYDDTTGIWTAGLLNFTSTATLTITATVNAGATTAGKTIINSATVSSPMNEPIAATNANTDTANIQVHGADLELTKTTTALPPIVEGDAVNYTVTVTNNGPDNATNIQVVDLIPINFDTAQTSVSQSEGAYDILTGNWTGINLLVGESATLSIAAVIESGGGITNTATITAVDQADSNQENNTASVFLSALKTFEAGACIINLGQSPQTYENTLKAYGLIYAIVTQENVPVWWSIRPDKSFGNSASKVDEIDFSAGGIDYRSGAFIIERPFVADAQAIIDDWLALYPTLQVNCNQPEFQAPIHNRITSFPRGVLDANNGGIIQGAFYDEAGLVNTQVGTDGSGDPIFDLYRPDGTPSNLTACDDIYAMPHADPHAWDDIEKETFDAFVKGGGWIWLACHAVSSLEALVDIPSIPGAAPNANYLSNAGLIPWGDHGGGTQPYEYSLDAGVYASEAASDPFMQFIGTIDNAMESGSESIYIPYAAGWRPTTTVGIWDPDHPEREGTGEYPLNAAAKLAYGYAYGNPNYGMVVYEASHSITGGTEQEDVGAARVYGNFWLEAGNRFRPEITPISIPQGIVVGQTDVFSASVEGQVPTSTTFTYQWVSSCSGTFDTPNSASTNFTPDPVSTATECIIRLIVTDECDRKNFLAETYIVYPITDLSIAKTATATGVAGQDTITYDLTVQNEGSEIGYSVNVEDVLPTGTTLASAIPSVGTFTAPNWSVGDLAPGASATISINASIDSNVADGASLDNTATVTSLSTDNNPANDSSSASTIVSALSDLVTVKTLTSATSTPDPGDSVEFTITVLNSGPSDATGVSLTDLLPAGLTITGNVASDGSYNDISGLWDGFVVASGASETLELTALVDNDQSGQTIQNLTSAAESTSPFDASTVGDDLEETIIVNTVVGGGTPLAKDDDFGIIEDSGLNVLDVLLDNGNGVDDFGTDGPNNGTITLLTATSAMGATITVNDNGTATNPTDDKVNYTTIPAYVGADNFSYRITDADGDTSTANVTLAVVAAVDPCDAVASGNPDADGDGVSDICDLDDDNDGILDTIECTAFNSPQLLNGDFEDNDILLLDGGPTDVTPASGLWKGDASNIPNWESGDAVNNHLEVWHNTQTSSNDVGGMAYSGTQWAEINATTNDGLYQDVVMTPGDVLQWSFAHRKRTGFIGSAVEDVMTLLIGDSAGTLVSQGNFTSAADASWIEYSGTYTVPVGQTSTRLSFAWVSSAAGSSSQGNFVDKIQLYVVSDCEDTDGDNIPDYLDTDSDADSCFDALEGNGGVLATQLDGTGAIDIANVTPSGVDANGIPNLVSGGQADVSSTDNLIQGAECLVACDGGTVGSDQNLCWGAWNVPAFTSTTPGSVSSGTLSYQWQLSTTDCTTDADFTDIAGATSETYDHGNVFTTTYFRRVTTNGTDCTEFSNCITVVMNRISILSTIENLSCADGPNDGAIDVTIGGTVGAYSVSWSNGATTEDISGLAAGDYTITVTDASGCPATQTTLTVGNVANPYAALLLTGTQGASPFPTTDYPVGTFPPDAVVGGEPGGYNQTYPTGTENFDISFDNFYIPADYILDPDWAGSATMTYTQDHAGTVSGAFFAAGSRETEFSDFGPGAIANSSGNTYYVYGRGLNGFGNTGFADGWTLTYDFTTLVNGYLPAGTMIAVTDVDGLASGGENVILNATLASGAITAWASDYDNSLTTPPHGAPTYNAGSNSYDYGAVTGAANGNWVLVTTEDLYNVTVNVTNNSGGSIGLKLAAPLVPFDVTLTGTDNTICFGAGVDGQIQVDLLGSVGPYDIAWDNGTGETGSVSAEAGPYTITDLPVGTYTVTVSAGSCSAQETVTIGCPDFDNDGISNIADLDDDNDGILDLDESGTYDPDGDEDGDGIPNWQDTTDDGTGDGSPTDYVDANGDGVPDVYDFDADGIPNHLDTDSDNDGCPDAIEGAGSFTTADLVNPGTDDSLGDTVNDNGIPIPPGTAGAGTTGQATTAAVTDNLDTTACATPITANNDNGLVTEGVGGTAVTNVLANDDLDGAIPTLATVDLTQVSTTNADVTLDPLTGAINVTTLVPAGTYVVEYQICESANTSNCTTAFATITVVSVSDVDGDGIDNETDLDDDNDGILDTDEGLCATGDLTTTWTETTAGVLYEATAGTTDIDMSFAFAGNSGFNVSGGTYVDGAFNTEAFWNEPLTGATSFQGRWVWDTVFDGVYDDIDLPGDDKGTGTMTITFSVPVENPVINFDRLGGWAQETAADPIISNSVSFTLTTVGASLTRLSGTDDFDVTATTIQRTSDITVLGNSESTQGAATGTAAGSVKIYGTYTTLTFDYTGIGVEGNGRDGIEVILSGICPTVDTDGDGTPDYLDTDSDNDGCPDAIEAAGTFSAPDLTTSDNLADPDEGQVDATGVPEDISAVSQQQATTAAVTDDSDSSACGADLSLTKTIDNATPKIGDTVIFTITLTNDGPFDTTDVEVNDLLPTGLTYDLGNSTIPAGTTYDAGTGLWDLNTLVLSKGDVYVLEIAAQITPACGEITNGAQITKSDRFDPDSTVNNNN